MTTTERRGVIFGGVHLVILDLPLCDEPPRREKLRARALIAPPYLISRGEFVTYTAITRSRRLHDNFNAIHERVAIPTSRPRGAGGRAGARIRNPVGREDERRNERIISSR